MPPETTRLLLGSDLDGTLLPDGTAPESERARPLFRRLAAHSAVCLVYVTGRSPGLVDRAMAEADLPAPELLVADVGASLHRRSGSGWTLIAEYWERIGPDWLGADSSEVLDLLAGIPGLRSQEPQNQARFKASFYLEPDTDHDRTMAAARQRLASRGLKSNLIYSQATDGRTGYLDCLPQSADKRQGLKFLRDSLPVSPAHTVFAGDSGNDLAVLGSEIHSVLVANAAPAVRTAALSAARVTGYAERLYLARGGYRGQNGNYAAGVVEGVVHFVPEADGWIGGE